MFGADNRYQYESRAAARERERKQWSDLRASISPLVAEGTSSSLLRASRLAQDVANQGKPPAPQSEGLLSRLFGGAADAFRDVVPQGVRDAAGGALNTVVSGKALDLLEEYGPPRVGREIAGGLVRAVGQGEAFERGQARRRELGVDKPGTYLGDQIERIPVVGPLARTAFDVAQAPATLATAGFGGAAAAGLRGTGTVAGRLGAAAISPVAPQGAGFGARLAAETATGVGAIEVGKQGARGAEALGLPAWTGGLAGGLAGGVAGAGVAAAGRGSLRRPGLDDVNIASGEPEVPAVRALGGGAGQAGVAPPPSMVRIFGTGEPVIEPLSRLQSWRNTVLDNTAETDRPFTAVKDDAIATTATRHFLGPEAQERIKSVAQIEGQGLQKLLTQDSRWDFDENWQLPFLEGKSPRIPGRPLIQEVGQYIDDYEPYLSSDQFRAIRTYEQMTKGIGEVPRDVGIKIAEEIPTSPTGFYAHWSYEPTNNVKLRVSDPRLGGKKPFEQVRVFQRSSDAVAKGYQPVAPWVAHAEYIQEVGERTHNAAYATFMKSAGDAGGQPFARTVSDYYDPQVKQRVDSLRQSLSGIRSAGANLSKRQDEAIDAFLTSADPDVEQLQHALSDLQVRVRASATGAQGPNFGATRSQLRDDFTRLKGDLDALLPEWKHDQAIARAMQKSPDRGSIDLLELQGTDFPRAMANAAQAELRKLTPSTNAVLDATKKLNGVIRSVSLNGELSFLFVQGLSSATNDPHSFSLATRAAVNALKHPEVRMAYLDDLSKRFEGTPNHLTPQEMAAAGNVHFGAGEWTVPTGTLKAVSELPGLGLGAKVVRKWADTFNRAWETFGDILRAERFDTELQKQLAKGVVSEDMIMRYRTAGIVDPALQAIGNHVNHATGWSSHAFLGPDAGGVLMLAPRYFQSQLDLAGAALTKWGPDSLEGELARKELFTTIGSAVAATEILNLALGNETERNPLEANFMTIRAGGYDISLLGAWGALLKGVVNTGKGAAGLVTADTESAKRGLSYFPRTKASPAVQMAWDLIGGKDFSGNRTRDDWDDRIKWFARQFSPLSYRELPNITERALSGDLGSAALGLGAGASGLKASPLTPFEELDEAAARLHLGKRYRELEPYQKEDVRKANPDIWQRAVERGSDSLNRSETVRSEYFARQSALDGQLIEGALTKEQWRNQRNRSRVEQSGRLEEIYGDYETRKGEPQNAQEHYLRAIDESKDPDTGIPDWDAVDRTLDALPATLRAEIEKSVGVGQTPVAREYARLSREYRELPMHKGYTADQSREITLLGQEVRNRGGDNQLRQLRAVRTLGEGMDPKVVAAVRKRVMGGSLTEATDRLAFKRKHPTFSALSGNGTLQEAERKLLDALREPQALS